MVRRELRNLLKNQTLDAVEPSAFKQTGGVVFPDATAAPDLEDFTDIVGSFKAVHLPTNGACPIPHTEEVQFRTMTDSSTSITFIIPSTNEVYEVVSVYAVTSGDYAMTSGYLAVGQNGSPIADLGDIDAHTDSFSGMVYGALINGTASSAVRNMFSPRKLYVVGGSYLSLVVANAPSSNCDFGCVLRKVMQ